MIWNDRFLFLHVPKTAGTSLTNAFLAAWARPISGIVSAGVYREAMTRNPQGLALTRGTAHTSLPRAKMTLDAESRSLSDFEAVFVAIRHPYDIMVSTYHFMRKAYLTEPDNPKNRFAMERDFGTFCRRIPMTDVGQWLSIDSRELDNLHLLRFERLADDFDRIVRQYGMNDIALPWHNASRHRDYEEYLTPELKETIYRKLPYLFDSGYYTR